MLSREDFSWDGMFWGAEHKVPEWQPEALVKLVLFPEDSSATGLNDAAMDIVGSYCLGREVQAKAALAALLSNYPQIYDSYVDAIDPDFVDQDLPKIASEAELLALVTLKSVHLHPVVAHGLPYVGFEAECSWDMEHGVGILMYGDRCVEVGGADTAILQWIAERDAVPFGGGIILGAFDTSQ